MPVGTRFNDCYIQATVKHPPSVMIWGAMSSNGTADFFFLPIETKMNDVLYQKMLEDKLKFTWLFMNTIYSCKAVLPVTI